MPPSGFSQKAINGLLEFVKANYEATLSQHNSNNGTSESNFLAITERILEQKVKKTIVQNTPLEISTPGIQGIVTFVTSCYEDLVREIQEGKDKHGRSVTNGKAIQKEIDQIGKYLKDFTI
jgi:hypothetical protein